MGEDELCHYGILGMRWGKHKRKKSSDKLTKTNKDEYNKDIEKAKQKIESAKKEHSNAVKKYNKSTLGGMIYNPQAANDVQKSAKKVKYAKEDLSNVKIKQKIADKNHKSKRQLKLEEQYSQKGMSADEAEIAAYKRVRTEKALAVTAGLTVAAATAYAVYKHRDNKIDKIIKSGTTLQNISVDSNKGVSDAFYASMTKMDNTKYRGMYGDQLRKQSLIPNSIYETKIGVTKDIKVASRNSATNALSELVKKDKSYAKNLEEALKEMDGGFATPRQNRTVSKALSSIKKGKVDSKVYEALNLSLVNHTPSGQAASKGLFDTLKSKGYDSIKDINDAKYSGYKSRNPIIVFNGASKTKVDKIREVGAKEINKCKNIGYADILTRDFAKKGAIAVSAIMGIKAVGKGISSKRNDKVVADYRKKHPNTALSYNEILRNEK